MRLESHSSHPAPRGDKVKCFEVRTHKQCTGLATTYDKDAENDHKNLPCSFDFRLIGHSRWSGHRPVDTVYHRPSLPFLVPQVIEPVGTMSTLYIENKDYWVSMTEKDNRNVNSLSISLEQVQSSSNNKNNVVQTMSRTKDQCCINGCPSQTIALRSNM